jgi:hypothetical protein
MTREMAGGCKDSFGKAMGKNQPNAAEKPTGKPPNKENKTLNPSG